MILRPQERKVLRYVALRVDFKHGCPTTTEIIRHIGKEREARHVILSLEIAGYLCRQARNYNSGQYRYDITRAGRAAISDVPPQEGSSAARRAAMTATPGAKGLASSPPRKARA